MEILKSLGGLEGQAVAVINDSDIVGKPLAMMLGQEGATVTVCHDRSPLKAVRAACREADAIVVAVGIPGFLDRSLVHKGQTVVDVGINRVGGRVVGDVHPEVYGFAGAWTPVPGGVGPCTVAFLLKNVLRAAWLNNT